MVLLNRIWYSPLAEVCDELDHKDATIDLPKKTLVGRRIYLNRCAGRVLSSLGIDSFIVKSVFLLVLPLSIVAGSVDFWVLGIHPQTYLF